MGSLTSFIGRDDDIVRVVEAVGESRLVTLTGSGGMGKTRVAVEVLSLRSSTQPVVAVELVSVRSDESVPLAVLDGMGISPSGTLEPVEQLARSIGDRELLLLLDNCEHVLVGVRGLVRALLGRLPSLRVLATSRESLGIGGERVVALRALSAPAPTEWAGLTVERSEGYDAVRLLVERASAQVDDFELVPANVAAIGEICARLDGVPLAIELAVTRLRSMSASELLAGLDERFEMLNRGDPTRAVHHRTLRGMVEWSWDLCTPGEQRLWARMSVFAGGADFAAVRTVCADESDSVAAVRDDIDGLVGKSVLSAERDPAEGRTRYSMLETLVEFGRERLADSGDLDGVADQHAAYFRDLARQSGEGYLSSEQRTWGRRWALERTNLLMAFERLLETGLEEGRAALGLAVDLQYYWFAASLPAGVDALGRALARCEQPGPLRIAGLASGSLLLVGVGDLAGGLIWATRGVREAEDLGDPAWLRRAVVAQAVAGLFNGVHGPLDATFEEPLAALEADGDLTWTFIPRAAGALSLLRAGDYEQSRRATDRMKRTSDSLGESWFRAWADGIASVGTWMLGDPETAEAEARRAFEVQEGYAHRRLAISMTLIVLASMAGERGQQERAARLFGAAAGARQRAGVLAPSWGPDADGRIGAITEQTRAALGAEPYRTLEAEGWSLDSEALRTLVLDPGHGVRAGPSPSARDPGLLTAREYEVATLVAQGLTNRTIAEQLFLSPRTIDGHLERILGKLGFRSRAQVAAWVTARSE